MTTYGAAPDAEDTLRTIAQNVRYIERTERHVRELVAIARREGATWTHIALALGVSRQAVTQKYGPITAQFTGVPREPGE